MNKIVITCVSLLFLSSPVLAKIQFKNRICSDDGCIGQGYSVDLERCEEASEKGTFLYEFLYKDAGKPLNTRLFIYKGKLYALKTFISNDLTLPDNFPLLDFKKKLPPYNEFWEVVCLEFLPD